MGFDALSAFDAALDVPQRATLDRGLHGAIHPLPCPRVRRGVERVHFGLNGACARAAEGRPERAHAGIDALSLTRLEQVVIRGQRFFRRFS